MNILVIGGTGSIGAVVAAELKKLAHNVIVAGSKSGDIQLDITKPEQIEDMYKKLPQLDAVVTTTGKTYFGNLDQATADDFSIGINSKLMGQVNVVLIGQKYVSATASFTLTSGILNKDPLVGAANAALVNGALDGFTVAAAIDLPAGMRINIVSPTLLSNSVTKFAAYFSGYKPVDEYEVALAYIKSITGKQTGQIYHVGY